MTTREVTFDSIEEVKKFVNQVEQYPRTWMCAAEAVWWMASPSLES